MHTLKLSEKPCKLHSVRFNMAKHSEFIVTQEGPLSRCDLGGCVIGLRPPYFVAKIHTFRTQDKRVEVSERNEKERCEWLVNRKKAYELARQADEKGLTVREVCGDHYDEQLDEPRMVAKVPGLNIYLELLGTLTPEDVDGERFWQERQQDSSGQVIRQPFDRMIDAAAATALNRMAYFMRTMTARKDRRDCATQMGDWQPRDEWQEDYDDDEYFQRPDQHGIGFDFVDESRRPAQFPKHNLSDAEKAEYQKLKMEAERLGEVLDKDALARLARQACENVAAYNLIKK